MLLKLLRRRFHPIDRFGRKLDVGLGLGAKCLRNRGGTQPDRAGDVLDRGSAEGRHLRNDKPGGGLWALHRIFRGTLQGNRRRGCGRLKIREGVDHFVGCRL
jgi:hypothetical protein